MTPTTGYLKSGYTHTINVYQGCAFAGSLCGMFCYAQHNRWITKGRAWGIYAAKRWVREAYCRLIVELARSCELWVSLTVETDMEHIPGFPPHASSPRRRLETLRMFRERGGRVQGFQYRGLRPRPESSGPLIESKSRR